MAGLLTAVSIFPNRENSENAFCLAPSLATWGLFLGLPNARSASSSFLILNEEIQFFPSAKMSMQLAKSLIANCECLARTL
jgi:hypothetical protein